MKKPLLRVVVDTKVIISGLLLPTGKPHQMIELWRENKFILLQSNILLNEIYEVLKRDKLKKYLVNNTTLPSIHSLLIKQSEIVKITKLLPIKIRDVKNEIVIATALSGNADYIITGDNDLLVLNKHPMLTNVAIVSVAEFLTIVNKH